MTPWTAPERPTASKPRSSAASSTIAPQATAAAKQRAATSTIRAVGADPSDDGDEQRQDHDEHGRRAHDDAAGAGQGGEVAGYPRVRRLAGDDLIDAEAQPHRACPHERPQDEERRGGRGVEQRGDDPQLHEHERGADRP